MEPLIDPLGDRMVKTVPPPPHRPLKRELFFPPNLKGKPDWKLVRDHLQKEGRILKEDVIHLIAETSKVLSNFIEFIKKTRAIYCIFRILWQLLETFMGTFCPYFSQFFDFLKILEIGGSPEKTKYLFLGDFVDRGSFSIEVLILLYSLKVKLFLMFSWLIRNQFSC